eukprot:TRINITY_DN1436_c0_g1_i4.p2 TRINITY_DN1436_c0_g1~~TRINITY_DN1436_c0_g1_i4.p2  ORF type:complete len:192 (-),score=-25.49 TRINITY_DN1436_c0_g1_i4:1513-2088(-)
MSLYYPPFIQCTQRKLTIISLQKKSKVMLRYIIDFLAYQIATRASQNFTQNFVHTLNFLKNPKLIIQNRFVRYFYSHFWCNLPINVNLLGDQYNYQFMFMLLYKSDICQDTQSIYCNKNKDYTFQKSHLTQKPRPQRIILQNKSPQIKSNQSLKSPLQVSLLLIYQNRNQNSFYPSESLQLCKKIRNIFSR